MQHDYNIANSDGATVRADINSALQSLAECSSGATAPSTTFAYQWWADTANDLLKQRNAANSGWISVLTLSTGAVTSGGQVADDTSPQLGGDLDLNSNNITGTGDIPAANLTGTLPAINGSSLTGISTQKNIIINGDFNIWQRGTSFAACSDNEYQADRFKYSKVGAMVHTISRDTDVPTVAESGHLSNYSMKVDCTTIDSSIAAGDECHIFQSIEGYNFRYLAQKAMTLSFWHKHTKTGTYCVSFRNTGHNQSYVAEYTQTTTDTWEKATINISASPTGGAWDYTNGVGIKIGWSIAMGSNYHTTADAWAASSRAATSNQVNACDSTSNNFMLAQVQLEAGSVATDFEVKNYADELARCQRYYYDMSGVVIGTAWHANFVSNVVEFPVTMRTAPTMGGSPIFNVNAGSAGTPANAWTITPDTYPIYNSASNWTVSAWIKLTANFSAEL